MGIVKYTEIRTYNIGKAITDGWGIKLESLEDLIGMKLQDRKKPKHIVEIKNTDWFMGIFRVFFKEGGWLCFDHCIEQFKLLKLKP